MSGGFNPISMISQVALGVATGGTSLFAQLAMQVVSSVIQEAIQTVGDQLGLPQPLIDMAQGAAAGSVGDFQGAIKNSQQSSQGWADALGDMLNASPSQRGDMQRQMDDLSNATQGAFREAWENAERRGNSKGSRSWLQAIADAIGKAVDAKANQMNKLAESADESRQATTDYQV